MPLCCSLAQIGWTTPPDNCTRGVSPILFGFCGPVNLKHLPHARPGRSHLSQLKHNLVASPSHLLNALPQTLLLPAPPPPLFHLPCTWPGALAKTLLARVSSPWLTHGDVSGGWLLWVENLSSLQMALRPGLASSGPSSGSYQQEHSGQVCFCSSGSLCLLVYCQGHLG